MPTPDLTNDIETSAAEVKRVTTDGQTTEAHDLPDLIEADQYLKGQDAAGSGTNPNGGVRSGFGMLRPARAVPPGAC